MSSSDQGGYDISGSGFQDQPSSGWSQQGDQPARRQQRQGQFDDSSGMGGSYGDTMGQGQQQFQSSGGQGTGHGDDTTGSAMYGSGGGDVSGRSGATGYEDEFGLSQGTQSQYGQGQYGQGQTGQGGLYGQGQTGQGQTQSGQAQYDQSGKRSTGQKVKDFVKDTF